MNQRRPLRLTADPLAAAGPLAAIFRELREEDGRPPPTAAELLAAAQRWSSLLVGRGSLHPVLVPRFEGLFQAHSEEQILRAEGLAGAAELVAEGLLEESEVEDFLEGYATYELSR